MQEMQQEPQVQPLGGEDALKGEMAIHSNILAWKIPWTEEPSGLQSMGVIKDSDELETEHQTHIVMIIMMHTYLILKSCINQSLSRKRETTLNTQNKGNLT